MDLQAFVGKLTGNPEKDIKQLANFVFMQNEEIRYLLQNLDVTNFNDLGLARYENGRMQLYAEQVEIRAKALEAVFEENTGEINEKVTSIEATVDGLSTTVKGYDSTIGGLQSQVTQNAGKIALVVEDDNGINAAAIALAINNGGSRAMIKADQIEMTGSTKFLAAEDIGANGTTVIDGGRIQSGEIVGVTFRTKGESKFSEITIQGNEIDLVGSSIYHKLTEGVTPDDYAGLRVESASNLYLGSGSGSTWITAEDEVGNIRRYRFSTSGIFVFDKNWNTVGEIPINR